MEAESVDINAIVIALPCGVALWRATTLTEVPWGCRCPVSTEGEEWGTIIRRAYMLSLREKHGAGGSRWTSGLTMARDAVALSAWRSGPR